LTPRARPRAEPADLIPTKASQPNVMVYSDPSQSGVGYLFEHPEPFPRQANTRVRRLEAVRCGLALPCPEPARKIRRRTPGSFVNPQTMVDYTVPGWRTAVLTAAGRLGNWQEIAVALEQEHRRAFERGFTEDELRIVRANWANAFDEGVRTAATRPSGWLADTLAGCLLYGQVFSTPEVVRDDMAAALAATTATECTAAFRRVWSNGALHVFLATHPAFPSKAANVAAVLNQSREHATQALARPATAPFAYVDFGPPGPLVAMNGCPISTCTWRSSPTACGSISGRPPLSPTGSSSACAWAQASCASPRRNPASTSLPAPP